MRYQLRVLGDGKHEVVDVRTGQVWASTSVDVARSIQAQLNAAAVRDLLRR